MYCWHETHTTGWRPRQAKAARVMAKRDCCLSCMVSIVKGPAVGLCGLGGTRGGRGGGPFTRGSLMMLSIHKVVHVTACLSSQKIQHQSSHPSRIDVILKTRVLAETCSFSNRRA